MVLLVGNWDFKMGGFGSYLIYKLNSSYKVFERIIVKRVVLEGSE